MSRAVNYDPFTGPALEQTLSSTESQKELWTASQLGPEASCAFNESISLLLRGPLDLGALQQALNQLLTRHEALRATFAPADARLCLGAARPSELPLEDLTSLAEAERQGRIKAACVEEVETPFALAKGPLVRFRLLRLQPEDHRLMLTVHHIVCDGWSMSILLEELARMYTAACLGQPVQLPPPPSFSAYARQAEEQSQNQEAEAYWLERFQGELPVLDLPLDHPRPPLKTFRAARFDFPVDAETAQGLRRLGAATGCSLFNTLLAGLAIFFQRVSGQQDLIIGIPAAGQATAGMDRLVGHCVNFLPIRCKISPTDRVATCLQQLRSLLLDAFEHQQLTFGTLLSKLRLPRDPSRTPLVNVTFNLERATTGRDLPFADLQVEVLSNPRHFEIFEIFINAVENRGQLLLECQYNLDLFDPDTIGGWLESWTAMLKGMSADPEQSVGRLPLLSQAQQQRILVDWNATSRPYPREQTLPQYLDLAGQTPAKPAVVCGQETLTYAQLEQSANQLAHYLQTLGVQPGKLVGLLLERSVPAVVGVLAILKAGAGYVPLDPAWPPQRRQLVLADAQAALVLTQDKLAQQLGDVPVVCIDRDAAAIATQPTAPPASRAAATDTAYVIYTSGTTGQPKGVPVVHTSIVNLFDALRHDPGMEPNDVLLAVSALTFDISVLELLLPLSVGATVVLATEEEVKDGRQLLRLLAESGATTMQATPASWRMLLQAGWSGHKGLKVFCGGEALTADLARPLLERCASLWNLYGPTETTIYSTGFLVPDAGHIRIGRPLANTQAYVLDDNLEPMPMGVWGELYLGGAGVAPGYWHRPELTSQCFVDNPFYNPFADYLNPRLYRTGDLVRWRSDGTLEYLGRNDFQVKLRGHRIELGEIETVLNGHPAVRQSIAMVRQDRPTDARLVVYFVRRDHPPATVTELRNYLRQRLPEYMVPQHFVELEALPLTSSGKVNRRQLPAPFAAQPAAASEWAPPQTPQEIYLAQLWQEALGAPRIGRGDFFFNLGGHSLLGFQLLTRLEKETGLQLRPLALAVNSLEQLAAQIPLESIKK